MSRSVALSLAAAAAVAVTLLLAFHADDALELPLRDAALRLAPATAAGSTVVVAIDEPSLRVFGRWPWPRTVLADLIDRASALGARGVVLDVLLAEPADGDLRLTEAMRQFLRGAPNIRGKAVSIGPTALGLDRVLTSVSSLPDPGVTVHAAATESLVRGEIVREIPPIAAMPRGTLPPPPPSGKPPGH